MMRCHGWEVLTAGLFCLSGVSGRGLAAPVFSLPGHEDEAGRMNELLALHLPAARTTCSLWDAWLPMSTLWAATGDDRSAAAARKFYRHALLMRPIDGEGYVSMQQHRGMAHSEGWPFPGWQQSTGMGWHFSLAGDGWAVQNFKQKPLDSAAGWGIEGAETEGVDEKSGLKLRATGAAVVLTTPLFSCGTVVAPFIRIEWAGEGLEAGAASLQWRLKGETEWAGGRQATFPIRVENEGMGFSNVPVHRQPGYSGLLEQVRLVIPAKPGARISLKSVITAIDTRHPVTNTVFLQACAEYFEWTTDLDFLRERLPEMRRALRYALEEFQVPAGRHVRVPWVGHDGRTGIGRDAAGGRLLRPGTGVGNNYWDLLPFGGEDGFATMQMWVALRRMAVLERHVDENPSWGLEPAAAGTGAGDLEKLAGAVRDDFQKRFWNEQTGRFLGWIDVDGGRHDYGFTFLNTEAVHHGLASPSQERAIFDWLDGRRTVDGDTSQGADIFHWRFGPRSTTRRNTETYVWVWSHPENIAWGNQVQDGGAVLGFTYYELMARLRVQGPDKAWERWREVLTWFGEVQSEGGYRAYYAKPGRGSLQGGGPPGGLGFDHEFMESVLAPQVMVYGFFGLRPRPGGLEMLPRLPSSWSSAKVAGVHVQGHVFDITVEPDAVALHCQAGGEEEFELWLPEGAWMIQEGVGEGAFAPDGLVHSFGPDQSGCRLRWTPGQSRRFRRM